MGFTFVIYIFLSNNPSSGDINSSNLPCCNPFHNHYLPIGGCA